MVMTWKHICVGGEICSGCAKKAEAGEKRTWRSGFDQDDLFCAECAFKMGLAQPAQPVGTNADGKFCARRNSDGSPCICDADVNMNGGCVFWLPVKPAAAQQPPAASGETMSNAYDRPVGFTHESQNCVVRALSMAANIPYKDVHAAFNAAGRPDKHGINTKKTIQKVCKMLNLEAKQVKRSGSLDKLKAEFPNESLFVTMRSHAFPVIRGVAHDVHVNAHIKGAWVITKKGVVA
jgi:hypothetical protein